ncbi:MAG: hypothetical protein U5K79_03515 [Cyclobacteriaceae bacterium]|nr:hypothetical protein [Cyclobacteriaceae bacterium]
MKSNLYIINGRVTVGTGKFWRQTYVATRWWRGKLDEVGMWSRALRSVDVQTLYNNGNPIQHPF